MSEIKVNSIKGVGASSAAITVNNTDGTCTANITNNLSNRNLIINGAMEVAQRGTSSTSAGYKSIDRFQLYFNRTGVTNTQSQQSLSSSDTPYASGFRKFFRAALSGAGTANTDAEVGIFYRFEAQDIASSGWNYISSTSYITLQFWFRCSTNQTFYCYLESQDGTGQSYPFSFTATGNNTWTKITKTFSGNSNLQFDNDANYGLQLAIIPFFGTDLTNNKTLDQWSAFSASNRLPDMASTWLTAGASTFDLTGVQLEVGSVATDFEHRSFPVEKRLCMRYYQQYTNIVAVGYTGGSVSYHHGFTFPVEMRAAPTYSITNTGSSNGQYVTDSDNNGFIQSVAGGDFQAHNMAVHFNHSGSLTNYRAAILFGVDATAYQTTHKLSAEL